MWPESNLLYNLWSFPDKLSHSCHRWWTVPECDQRIRVRWIRATKFSQEIKVEDQPQYYNSRGNTILILFHNLIPPCIHNQTNPCETICRLIRLLIRLIISNWIVVNITLINTTSFSIHRGYKTLLQSNNKSQVFKK